MAIKEGPRYPPRTEHRRTKTLLKSPRKNLQRYFHTSTCVFLNTFLFNSSQPTIIYNMEATTQFSVTAPVITGPEYLQEATTVVFFSFFIKAFLFMKADGELRVNPACGPEGRVLGQERILKYCVTRSDDVSRCVYGSASGSHLLAMSASTGRLTTVLSPQHLPNATKKSENQTCLWFEERVSKRGVSIIGCPGSRRFPLSVVGPRLHHSMTCQENGLPGIYTQAGTTAGDENHHGRRFAFQTKAPRLAFDSTLCSHMQNLWSRCPNMLRRSYPVNWSSCETSTA